MSASHSFWGVESPMRRRRETRRLQVPRGRRVADRGPLLLRCEARGAASVVSASHRGANTGARCRTSPQSQQGGPSRRPHRTARVQETMRMTSAQATRYTPSRNETAERGRPSAVTRHAVDATTTSARLRRTPVTERDPSRPHVPLAGWGAVDPAADERLQDAQAVARGELLTARARTRTVRDGYFVDPLPRAQQACCDLRLDREPAFAKPERWKRLSRASPCGRS